MAPIPSVNVAGDHSKAPPRWAVLQRHVFDKMSDSAKVFVDTYTRPDGTLIWSAAPLPPQAARDSPPPAAQPFPHSHPLASSHATRTPPARRPSRLRTSADAPAHHVPSFRHEKDTPWRDAHGRTRSKDGSIVRSPHISPHFLLQFRSVLLNSIDAC